MPKDVVPSSAIWNLLLSLVVIFAHLQVVTCFSELGCENKKQSTHVPNCKYTAVQIIWMLWCKWAQT